MAYCRECCASPACRRTRALRRLTGMQFLFLLLLIPVHSQTSQTCPDFYTYKIVAEYPHDPNAFTQGLEYEHVCEGSNHCRHILWESTGLHGRSGVRMVDLETGQVHRKTDLAQRWFGEGITRLNGKLYQVTWQTNTGFSYHLPSLTKAGRFKTPLRDGWGLTTDGQQLIASDGSSTLSWLDPAAGWNLTRSVSVHDTSQPVGWLNELEWVDGEVWANVWQTECIARIHLASGLVKGWVLMHGLQAALAAQQQLQHRMDVLNGVAWDANRKKLFVTGKLWPKIFEISVVPANGSEQHLQALRKSCWVGDT